MTIPSANDCATPELTGLVLDARSGTPEAIAALDEYLAANPHHAARAAQMEAMWDRLGQLSAPPLRLAAQDADGGLARRIMQSLRRPLPLAALAASLALVVTPVVGSLTAPTTSAATEFVANDAMREIRLADGSIVTLANNSAIKVELTSDARQLHLLRGEAYFDVAKDRSRPFVVKTQFGQTTAVGTEFNIRTDGMQAIVTVTEGTVSIAPKGDKSGALASVGQQVRYWSNGEGRPVTLGPVSDIDAQAVADWRSGYLRFSGTRLVDVIEVVNRHSSKRLTLAEPSLAATEVFAILKLGEVDSLVALVAAHNGIAPSAMQQYLRVEDSD